MIATEKGWNLYVCGNGGAEPAHAQLLAGDLDTETLISYLDRFLMYYIRTADRLQRTAAWLDTLDGGLDRVREVVVDDSLGLGAELEAEMARHVGTYFDEWKATLEDPEKLAASSPSSTRPDTPDPNISFTEERGQIKPADRRRAGRARRHDPRGRSATRAGAVDDAQRPEWEQVCPVDDLEVERGVTALVHGQAVAIFRTHDDQVYALGNHDPFAKASVLARGIVGTRGDVPFVASPMHKHAFDLRTGQCLDDEHVQRAGVRRR